MDAVFEVVLQVIGELAIDVVAGMALLVRDVAVRASEIVVTALRHVW